MAANVRCVAVGTLSAIALSAFANPLSADVRPIGDTRVFAVVPEPGQPGGIVVDRGEVHVTTLGVAHDPVTDHALFTYRAGRGDLIRTRPIHRHMAVSAMGLAGVAVDGHRRIYVADMNGRVLRMPRVGGSAEHYAEFPASAGGLTVMPFDLVFDDVGNLYVTDQNLATIWRVGPGGSPVEPWFTDERFAGYLTGASGITLDPATRTFYVTVGTSAYPTTAGLGVIYSLPLDDPSAEAVREVVRYPARSNPFDVALGASGKLYVALMGANQISILSPSLADGAWIEERRFPSPEDNASREVPYDRPVALAFDGDGSLLVTNSSWMTDTERHMVVLDAYVDDVGIELPTPPVSKRFRGDRVRQ